MKLQFVHYFDVWGNEDDGYDVNDVRKYLIEVEELTDNGVVNALKDQSLLALHVTKDDLVFEHDCSGIELRDSESGEPFGRLQF